MIKAIALQENTREWKQGFIPNPLTWLNQGRWDDEVPIRRDDTKAQCTICGKSATMMAGNKPYCSPACRKKGEGW